MSGRYKYIPQPSYVNDFTYRKNGSEEPLNLVHFFPYKLQEILFCFLFHNPKV